MARTLRIQFVGDTSNLDRALGQVARRVAQNSEAIRRTSGEYERAFGRLGESAIKASRDTDEGMALVEAALTRAAAAGAMNADAMRKLGERHAVTEQQVRRVEDAELRYRDALLAVEQAADRVQRAHKRLADVVSKYGEDSDRARRATVAMDRAHLGQERAALRASRAERDLGDALRALGAGGDDGNRGLRRLLHSMGDLPGRIYISTRALGALAHLMLLLAPAAAAAGAALWAVGSALAPIVGVAPAVAGGLLALVQGFGVLKLATAGVGDALKEQIKAQDGAAASAVKSAAQQRASAKAIETAQEGVRDAHRQAEQAARAVEDANRRLDQAERDVTDALRRAKQAQDDLNQARFQARLNLVDLAEQVDDLQRAEREARLEVAKAEQRLNEVMADGASTWIERQEAENALADAQDRLSDTTNSLRGKQLELAAAQKKGVRDADNVRQAQERVRDANRGVADANERVREAEQGVQDARERLADASRNVERAVKAVRDAELDARDSATGAAAATQQLNAKFNELPPAAQAFVRVLQGLKPRFDELRSTAAQGLFPGLTAGVQSAMGSFDDVQRVVGRTARTMGDLAREGGALVGSPAFGKDIERIGTTNAKVLGNFGRAGLHLLDALRHILVVARPLTEWLGRLTERWAQNVAESAKAGRETGRMAAFFDKAKERAELFGTIIANLVGGLFGLGSASDRAGKRMLEDFAGLTARFNEWANSVRGRTEIHEFMMRVRDALRDIGPALGALIKGLGHFATTALPAYARVAKMLGPILDELVTLFIAWKFAATAAAAATGLWTAAQWLLNKAMDANPIALVVTALAALAAGVVIAYRESETFRKIVDKVWGALKKAAEAVAGFVTDLDGMPGKLKAAGKAILNGIVDGIKALPGVIKDAAEWLAGAWFTAVKTTLKVYLAVGGWVIERVIDGIKALPGVIMDGAKWLAETWFGLVKLYLSAYKSVGGWIINRIVDGVKALPGVIKDAAEWVATTWFNMVKTLASVYVSVGGWVIERVIDGIKALPGVIKDAAQWLFDMWKKGVEAYANVYKTVGGWIINRIVDGVTAVASFAGRVGGWVRNRVVEGVHALKDSFMTVGGWIINRIVDGVTAVASFASRVGGWVRNRVVEGVHALKDSFVNAGSWVLNRISDGITTVTEKFGGVAGWVKNRIVELFERGKGIADGFVGVGRSIINWITDGITKGIKVALAAVVRLADGILSVIDKIPGVDLEKVRGGLKDWAKDKDLPGFARGGAYARTRGIVDAPITLMGEEAPRHPEYVIPTNPAYRGRAQQLVLQAAEAVGLARGGIYSQDEIRGLASQVGVDDPHLMSAIAMAESGGNARAFGPPSGKGLWQIEWNVWGKKFAGMDPYDAFQNAIMMRAVLLEQGLRAWVAYNNGSYRKFMGGRPSLVAAGAKAVGGVLGDLIKFGPKVIIDQLPNPAAILPDWLHGMGRWVIDRVTGWITDKVAGLVSGGGSDAPMPEGVKGSVRDAIALAMSMGFPHPSPAQLTGGRHSKGSLHYAGRAVDFGDAGRTPAQMADLFMALYHKFGRHLNELFYDPMGWYIDNHRRVGGAIGGHGDHIHAAFARGGRWGGDGVSVLDSYRDGTAFVPRTGPYLLHRGEAVVPASQNAPIMIVIEDGAVDPERIRVVARQEVEVVQRAAAAAYSAGVVG